MKAVIMAGGKGTRMQSIAKDIPKPMFSVLDKPILQYQIESLKKCGITKIIIIVGHLGNIIQSYFKDGTEYGVEIQYIVEKTPLGTAGSLFYLKDIIQNDFILVFGDLILDIDWNRFTDFHRENKALITMYGHPNDHPYDSDIIITDSDKRVIRIEAKNTDRNFYYHNFVNAGVYCINYKILDCIVAPKKIDFEKEIIANQIGNGTVFAYGSTEYVKDMGTPDRLESVTVDIMNGIVSARSLKNKQRAIFLDRDGTINVLKGFLNSAEEFELLPTVVDAIKKINSSKYISIVITNQPVIARGDCTFKELENIHKKMETELGKQGAFIDDLFFCPHHPDKGYEGEIVELKVVCECRKPKIGMLIQAAEKYNIDLSKSWYIGDTTVDIQTGINACMGTILVKTGEAGQDNKYNVKPDYVAKNLLDAIEYIINSENSSNNDKIQIS